MCSQIIDDNPRKLARKLARHFQDAAELAKELDLNELTKMLQNMEAQILRQIVDGEFG